jgi:hypothetical protein
VLNLDRCERGLSIGHSDAPQVVQPMLAQDRGQVGLGHVIGEGAVLEDEFGGDIGAY